MADFLDEVIEDVRQQQFRQLFQKYGHYVVTAVLGVVVATGATIWYKDTQRAQQKESGSIFYSAKELLDASNKDEALRLLEGLSSDGAEGYQLLARLHQANILLTQKEKMPVDSEMVARAMDLYLSVVADSKDKAISELAMLQAIQLATLYPDLSTKLPHPAAALLEEMAQVGRPWRHLALELQATRALTEGDRERAKALLTTLNDDALTPSNIREAAAILLKTLNISQEPAS